MQLRPDSRRAAAPFSIVNDRAAPFSHRQRSRVTPRAQTLTPACENARTHAVGDRVRIRKRRTPGRNCYRVTQHVPQLRPACQISSGHTQSDIWSSRARVAARARPKSPTFQSLRLSEGAEGLFHSSIDIGMASATPKDSLHS